MIGTVELPYREPMTVSRTLDFLGAHAVAGVETYRGGRYTRVLAAPGGPALVTVFPDSPRTGAVRCEIRLHDTADRDAADRDAVVDATRRLLDLDADPLAVDAVLGGDPALAPLIARHPGLRVPGTVDAFETAVRTVVGQQISLRGARTVLGRLVAEYGTPIGLGGGWRLFPRPEALAAADPEQLPMPRARGRAVVALAAAFAAEGAPANGSSGSALADDPGRLLQLPGIGPWTVDYLRMRVAGDGDVLLASDLVVRRAAADLGVDITDGRPTWRPWRSYATLHLWTHLYADPWSRHR